MSVAAGGGVPDRPRRLGRGPSGRAAHRPPEGGWRRSNVASPRDQQGAALADAYRITAATR